MNFAKLGLQIAYIFGIPVIVAAVAGVNLDKHYRTGKMITLILLAIAFVLSWTIFIIKYKKIINQ